jgi:VanZ family protein
LFFPGFDKLVHCGLFFVLVVLYSSGVIRQQSIGVVSYKYLLLITLIAILYGGLIELLQHYFFTWRSGEWDDLFADATGACMGAFSIIITFKAIAYVKK